MSPTLIFLLYAMAGTDALNSVTDYPLKQIGCHTYVIYGAIGPPSPRNQGFVSNTGFVVTSEGVIVIDPGSSVQAGRMVLRRIRSVTDRPVTHVINTHSHGEHWLGNHAIAEAYPDVMILGHYRMVKEGTYINAQDWIEYLEHMTEGFTRGTGYFPPRESVEGFTKLTSGGITVLVHALEESKDSASLVVEIVEDSIAFVGEEFEVQRFEESPGFEDFADIAFCEVNTPVKTDFYVPGHGPVGLAGLVECPYLSGWTGNHSL